MKLSKVIVCTLALASFCLLPTFARAQKVMPVGIPSYSLGNYFRAKKVLKAQLPDFLTQFETLQETVSHLQDTDQSAQYKALMDFFPAIEAMIAVEPDITLDVVITYFVIPFETANDKLTSVHNLLFDAFKVYLAGGDATGILSEDDIMKKHNLSRAEAKHIREVLHKLYPSSAMDW